MLWYMVTWEEKHAAVHELIEWLPSTFDRMTRRLPDADMAEAASLARCVRLLLGLDRVAHDGDIDDVAGLYVRPLFETWLTGYYVGLGGDAAWEELKAGTRKNMAKMNRLASLGVDHVAAWADADEGPHVDQIAAKVSKRLRELNEPSHRFAVDAYNLVWRNASIRDVHGGAGPITGHVRISAGGFAELVPTRPEGIASRTHLLWCAVLVHLLAQRVFDRFELPMYRRRLEAITDVLGEARDPRTWSMSGEHLADDLLAPARVPSPRAPK
jgi:hypothetical protein